MSALTEQVRVQLNENEQTNALDIAHRRCREDGDNAVPQGYGLKKPRTPTLDIIGSLGEEAFAKYRGVPHVKGEMGDRDVDGFEVRSTMHLKGHLTIHHPKDRDWAAFVLTTIQGLGYPPLYKPSGRLTVWICGWFLAGEAKLKKFRGDPTGRNPDSNPAWWVPQHLLRPMSTLPKVAPEAPRLRLVR